MKILVIGNRIPWPLHDGGAMATYQLLADLSSAGNEVVYFSFNTKKHVVSKELIQQHFSFCEVIDHYLDASIRPLQALRNLFFGGSYFLERYDNLNIAASLTSFMAERTFDIVQIEGLYSYPLVRKQIGWWGEILTQSIEGLQSNRIPIIYRAHNVEHEIWNRLAQNETSLIKRFYLNIQSKRLKKEELELCKRVDGIIAISSSDQNYFEEISPKKTHLYLPSVKTPLKIDIHIQPDAIFHIGSMEWDANVQAIQWFLSKVWPLVKAAHPNLQFHLAGKGIDKHAAMFFQHGVINHGEVANADEFMKSYGIGVVPLLAGSGIRMKLIQAMSLGIPCVATNVAVQGLPIKKEDEIIAIASTAKEFASELIELLHNRKKAIRMAKAGHAYGLEYHNPLKNREALEQQYRDWISAVRGAF